MTPAPVPYLPDAVVSTVAGQLQRGDDGQAGLLALVAFCGVSRQWREIGRRLGPDTVLHVNGLEAAARNSLGRAVLPLEARFRAAPAPAKAHFFKHAVQLFTGYTKVVLAGPGITDFVLLEIARRQGASLTSVELTDAPNVTDAGVLSFLMMCGNLGALSLTSKLRLRGGFLPALLARCTRLATLHITGAPDFFLGSPAHPLLDVAPNPSIRHLALEDVGGDAGDLVGLCRKLPSLHTLAVDGPPSALHAIVRQCPQLEEVCYTAGAPEELDAVLEALFFAPNLRHLALVARGFALSPEHMYVLGMLPLAELRLDAPQFVPGLAAAGRSAGGPVTNAGVRALADSLSRRRATDADPRPYRLSLRGAGSLTHDAVSALLRLPLLSELRVDGCNKISAMDKMRLVAKVKAGREILAGARRGAPPLPQRATPLVRPRASAAA